MMRKKNISKLNKSGKNKIAIMNFNKMCKTVMNVSKVSIHLLNKQRNNNSYHSTSLKFKDIPISLSKNLSDKKGQIIIKNNFLSFQISRNFWLIFFKSSSKVKNIDQPNRKNSRMDKLKAKLIMNNYWIAFCLSISKRRNLIKNLNLSIIEVTCLIMLLKSTQMNRYWQSSEIFKKKKEKNTNKNRRMWLTSIVFCKNFMKIDNFVNIILNIQSIVK